MTNPMTKKAIPIQKAEALFLGATLETRPGWEEYFAPPVATRSTKPESQEKEIARKKQEREEQAPNRPFSGRIKDFVLLAASGVTIADSVTGEGLPTAEPGEIPAEQLLMCLQDYLYVNNEHGVVMRIGRYVFGLDVRNHLRIMALDILHKRGQGSQPDDFSGLIASSLKGSPPLGHAYWVDPYEVLVPSDLRNDVSYYHLCKFLGMTRDSGIDLSGTSYGQAEAARQLTIKSQLLPAPARSQVLL